MIKRIRVVGIGLGHSTHVTRAALEALAGVDVLVVLERGPGAAQRTAAQRALVAEARPTRGVPRILEPTGPTTLPGSEGSSAAYDPMSLSGEVTACLEALRDLPAEEDILGVLVWGDPALEAPTLEVVSALAQHLGAPVDITPGLDAAQLLAAAHHTSLGRGGVDVHRLSPAHLVDHYEPVQGDAVVVGDPHLRCLELAELYPDLEVCWGANLGSADQTLVRGPLGVVADELRAARAAAERARGWVLDAYLVRPSTEPAGDAGPGSRPGAAKPEPWPAVERLSDGVLTLRPMVAGDWPVLLEEHNNEESLRWAFSSAPMTEREARLLAAASWRAWSGGRQARLVMVDEATGRPAGTISLSRMGPPGVGLIGYGVLPGFRGRGFTVRALELLAEWAFRTTSLARLELGHKVGNVASGVVASRAGFVREGVLSGRLPNADGSYSDEVMYGRVRP